MRERQAIPLQTSVEQRPVAAGARLAPCRKAPRRQITIAFLARQRFELVRKEFVNCRSANHQAFKKSVHARILLSDGVSSSSPVCEARASRRPASSALTRQVGATSMRVGRRLNGGVSSHPTSTPWRLLEPRRRIVVILSPMGVRRVRSAARPDAFELANLQRWLRGRRASQRFASCVLVMSLHGACSQTQSGLPVRCRRSRNSRLRASDANGRDAAVCAARSRRPLSASQRATGASAKPGLALLEGEEACVRLRLTRRRRPRRRGRVKPPMTRRCDGGRLLSRSSSGWRCRRRRWC